MCFSQAAFSPTTPPLQWSIHDFLWNVQPWRCWRQQDSDSLFSTALFIISKIIKDKIYYKLSSSEAQGLCLHYVQIQTQFHKKQWSKQCVWNLFILPMLHSEHVPCQCKMLRKPSSWWGQGHPNGWGEIRGNRYSKVKLNEVKVICRRKRNPGYHLHPWECPEHPQPSLFPSHTSVIPKTLLWPCLVSIPNGLKFCPDKNVHQRKRVLIK